MNVYVLIWVFFLHFVADFAAQSRYIAENKGKNFEILCSHVGFYIFILGMGLYPFSAGYIDFWLFLGVNYLLHLVTDFITSKVTTYFWNKKNIYAFFTTIGFDQFLHATALLVTLNEYAIMLKVKI